LFGAGRRIVGRFEQSESMPQQRSRRRQINVNPSIETDHGQPYRRSRRISYDR